MATEQNTSAARFHNMSAEMLADEIGRLDAIVKAAEAELKAVKEAFKARGLEEVAGDLFTVTAKEQIAGRLDAKAIKLHLGESYHRFEVPVITTVVRIKAANRLLAVAA